MRIARRLNAGMMGENAQVPKGRLSRRLMLASSIVPSGLKSLAIPVPALKCRAILVKSLRDNRSIPDSEFPGVNRVRRASAGANAFTLLEVLLAISIAAGMLAVVLFFYTQAANLRIHVFYETGRVSAVRLLLDRLTTELSHARHCGSLQAGLRGGADNIEFVRLDLPNVSGWTNSVDPALAPPPSPFRLVRYAVLLSADGTNVTGLIRSEEPLLKKTVELVDDEGLASTNTTVLRRSPVPIDQIQFLQFRYWDGMLWTNSWNAAELPAGIEVSLGTEPLPEETTADEYPYELFRRVIFLPTHSTPAPSFEANASMTEQFP